MVKMFRTGVQPYENEVMIRPVRVLHAIEESFKSGKEVTL